MAAAPVPRKKSSPLPGRPVRGSATGRPVMALLDLLGRRWTLRLLWELRAGQPETFRSLQGRMDGVSPSILNTRLKELRDARVVAMDAEGYRLTPSGLALLATFEPLSRWASDWARSLERRRTSE
jgi:DNA-binding HxlR family transcriptional regulator